MGWISEVVCFILVIWTFICFLSAVLSAFLWPPGTIIDYYRFFSFLFTGVLGGIFAILISIWNMNR